MNIIVPATSNEKNRGKYKEMNDIEIPMVGKR